MLFAAVVEFEVDGVKWKIEDSIASRPAIYKKGEEVSVRFCLENPKLAKVQSEKLSRVYFWLNIASLIFILFFVISGLFVTILSLVALVGWI